MHEFDFITRYLKPLATNEAALNLTDDAALLVGDDLVVSTDTLNEGVHFFADTDPKQLAQKALRTSLSDMAAMGATPRHYLLNLSLKPACDEAWLAAFCAGLEADQTTYAMSLLGGDTTRGALSVTVTMFGAAEKPMLRSTAQEGDSLYVAGTIGDSALGLKAIQQKWNLPQAISAYHLPRPRPDFAAAISEYAHAAIDISDGLLQDVGHLCRASHLGAEIQLADIAISEEVAGAIAAGRFSLEDAITGGDDYVLCFTAPAAHAQPIADLASQYEVDLTQIGQMCEGGEVSCRDAAGAPVAFSKKGYQHF